MTVNANATQRLHLAAASADAAYNGSFAITAYAAEARYVGTYPRASTHGSYFLRRQETAL